MDYSAAIKEGEQLYSDGKKDQAIRLFQTVLARQPSNYLALNNIGVVCFSAGDVNAAETYFTRAVEANKYYMDALFNLALLYRASGRRELALRYLGKCSKIAKNYHQYNRIGKIFFEFGEHHKARTLFEESIKLNPLQKNIRKVLKALPQENIEKPGIQLENTSNPNSTSRLIIIADELMDWSARLTILSARLIGNFSGEIIMVGECKHSLFNRKMGVEFYSWEEATGDIHLDSAWGQFRKPQYKPFLINKFYKGPTIYLDSDIFCAKPFEEIINIDGKWGAAITRTDRNLISPEYLNLWGLTSAVNTQINSGVLVFRDQSIVTEWCKVFIEARRDVKKFDYIMNKQPWTYDQIGLIIAAARINLKPVQLDSKYNYEVAYHGWRKVNTASIIHLTNWKVLNFAESVEMDKRWYGSKDFIKCAQKVESISKKEPEIPPMVHLPNSIRSKKAASLIRVAYTSQKILLGLSQGIGNVIMGTPLIKALLQMGFSVDLLGGQFNNNSEQVIENIGVNIVNMNDAKKQSRNYALGLQGVWPVKGIEELCGQVVYAGNLLKYWDNYLFIHEVEANMAIAYALGFKNEIPSLYCHSEDKNPIQDIDKEKPNIGIHLSKKCSDKFYANRAIKHPERIACLLDAADCRTVLIGGKGCEPDLSLYPDGTVDLVGKLELAQTAGVIRSLDAMINEDSGIMHVCAAMDTPQVAVFGPTSVIKNRPWSNKAYVLQSNLTCQPCQFTPMMGTCKINKCMDLNYEESVTIITKLLQANSVERDNNVFFSYPFSDINKTFLTATN